MPNPCMNGGSPSNQNGVCYCQCPTPYSGSRCESRDPCTPNPCMNGGSPSKQGGSCYCQCPQGYSGSRCENRDGTKNGVFIYWNSRLRFYI